jgi:hypothetical protein
MRVGSVPVDEGSVVERHKKRVGIPAIQSVADNGSKKKGSIQLRQDHRWANKVGRVRCPVEEDQGDNGDKGGQSIRLDRQLYNALNDVVGLLVLLAAGSQQLHGNSQRLLSRKIKLNRPKMSSLRQ